MTYWAASELKAPLKETLWETPFAALLLCMREAARKRNGNCMTLQDKETIDRMIAEGKASDGK